MKYQDAVQDDSLFYCDVDNNDVTELFIEPLREYSVKNSKQVYILKKALGTNKEYSYDLAEIAIILMPKHPILILNYGDSDNEALEDFKEDFKEDLGHLADKFSYNKILGRVRKWPEDYFVLTTLAELDIDNFLNEEIKFEFQRKIDLLISLLIGSINSIDKIGTTEPETLLEKVKQKIILFDGQQSRFIYQDRAQKVILIQGMAGTGKTELLLHKLKDIYSTEKDSVIAFTCYNKVLANDMKSRIPQFFNFLKVDEQIEWGSRLHVFSSWGSASDPDSGMYRFICSKYKIPFKTYRENSDFNELCLSVLDELEKREEFEPCFDYVFIDESQDFKEGFIKLCEKVTKTRIYVAGDIFQNIFDTSVKTDITPDFLLNKCYRTDPKTLMFAHAVGMGLYETPQINWLDDSAWISCGYFIEKNSTVNTIELGRKPLRRFEDLDATDTIRFSISKNGLYSSKIIEAVSEIREENPSVTPEDIAIIILGRFQTICNIADETAFALQKEFDWSSTKGYETKRKEPEKVYISNVNNVKGLEFPFVICVVPQLITSNVLLRNSIYMTLTRSFLTSYFIVDEKNSEFYKLYKSADDTITERGKMEVHEPTKEEREEMVNRIDITLSSAKKSFDQIMEDFLNAEYPELSKANKEVIKITMRQLSELAEEDLKERTRILISEVLGVGNP